MRIVAVFQNVAQVGRLEGLAGRFGLFPKGEPLLAAAGGREGLFDRVVDGVKDVVFPGKADFGLGGVDVDVHKLGRHLEHQNAAGELALHGGALEGGLHPGHHGAVVDGAAVDVKILHAAAGPAAAGRGDQPVDGVQTLPAGHFEQVAAELTAEHRVGGAAQLPVAGGDILGLALPDELEADLGVAEGLPGDHVGHKGALAGVLFQELHPGGGIEEEVPHPDGGAHRPGSRLGGLLFPAFVAVEDGAVAALGAGQQLHPGDAGDGSQRLPPEAEGVDGGQVVL